MKKKKVIEKVAKTITNVLDSVLVVEANTNASLVFHQPKAPKDLSKFRFEKR